jgi:hypothetical protein
MSEFNSNAVTIDDPRVGEIADFAGLEPAEVLDEATEAANLDGITVDEELDSAVATVEMLESVMDEGSDADDSLDGWSEDDDDAEFIPC